jgi:quinoprotein dehydrogenase-associated probable ABC transporter substrate-binding protein
MTQHTTARLLLLLLSLVALPRTAWSQGAPQGADSSRAAAPPTTLSETPWKDEKVLRVCGDPDNLPFSNEKREGFDNKIADLIAKELGDTVSYVWWPARRGFIRNTLRERSCDVVIGVPTGFDPVATTRPYYRSTYYLVYRKDRNIHVTSLDDPALKKLKIGVNMIGEDYTNTPPAHALAPRGLVSNVVGFSTYYDTENHPGDIINALAQGKIDVAIVWGPLAGYFAKRSGVPMALVPLPDADSPELPFAYDVAIGTRRADKELRSTLDEILVRKKPEIDKILQEYNVPTVRPTRSATTRPGDQR